MMHITRSRQRIGAMVRKAADQVGVDFTAGAGITFDQEVYDTHGFHDNAINTTRLTIPPGFPFAEARLGSTITLANGTIGMDVTSIIRKNGTTGYDGTAQESIDAPTAAPCINVSGGWVPIVPGDYFENFLFIGGDAAVDVTAARTNFWIECR